MKTTALRLVSRGLLPMTRRGADFLPDAPAVVEWRREVLNLCSGYRFNLILAAVARLTRGEFAQHVWMPVHDQSPPAWPRATPPDADGDGIPDADDPPPFTKAGRSWPQE